MRTQWQRVGGQIDRLFRCLLRGMSGTIYACTHVHVHAVLVPYLYGITIAGNPDDSVPYLARGRCLCSAL